MDEFRDRADAGRQLARELIMYRHREPLVLALSPGGAAVAISVARALHAPLDALAVQPLAVPGTPELSFGALAPDGAVTLDTEVVAALGIDTDEIEAAVQRARTDLETRLSHLRGGRAPDDPRGRTAILVDDRLEPSAAVHAALEWAHRQHPARVILAAPVCAAADAIELAGESDVMVCLRQPRRVAPLAQWFRRRERFGESDEARQISRAQRGLWRVTWAAVHALHG